MSRVRVLVTGASGQVGRALLGSAAAQYEVRATTHSELDIGDRAQVERLLQEFQPHLVINAAAYTAVDNAESNHDAADRANAEGPANLANAIAKNNDARLIHVSTDFVFDGRQSRPYKPSDPTAPLGVYGQTKLKGELAVRGVLPQRAIVLRTAWVYAARGQNFMRTMLRLMNERDSVRVVADQIGTPTSANSLAAAIWAFAARPQLSGVYHFTDGGVASWYDFAVAIAEEGSACGLINRNVSIAPIVTADYPTPAKRPAFSVLDKSSTFSALELEPVHWRTPLRAALKELSVA